MARWTTKWLLLGLAACAQQEPEGGEANDTSNPSTSGANGSSSGGSEVGSSDGSSGGSSGNAESTTMLEESSSGNDTMSTMSTTGTPPMPRPCGLEDLDPSADPDAAIDEGDAVGQIPTVIGEVLLRNCGCHYTDMVPPGYVDYISHHQEMSTLAHFHENFMGTFPTGYETMPTYLAVEQRVVFSNPLPMPSINCSIDGNPQHRISDEDLATISDWLTAGAPDGASWPP
ncbi:MAG TPA: hypothetical protein VG755_44145 [Nannocystaceae bacterium]|nr:hypothetical protein [Nannocystaceae bacterium]